MSSSRMNLAATSAMRMKGSEFTVEIGNGMPMSVYVKGTDMEGKALMLGWDYESE